MNFQEERRQEAQIKEPEETIHQLFKVKCNRRRPDPNSRSADRRTGARSTRKVNEERQKREDQSSYSERASARLPSEMNQVAKSSR